MAKNKFLTGPSTTAITVATHAGYGKRPAVIDLEKASEVVRSQWHEVVGIISNTFFTEPRSAKCVVQELEIAMEMKMEGGFRFILSGNFAVSGALRAKFVRKEEG